MPSAWQRRIVSSTAPPPNAPGEERSYRPAAARNRAQLEDAEFRRRKDQAGARRHEIFLRPRAAARLSSPDVSSKTIPIWMKWRYNIARPQMPTRDRPRGRGGGDVL